MLREPFGSGSQSVDFRYLKRSIFTLNAVTPQHKHVLYYTVNISMCNLFSCNYFRTSFNARIKKKFFFIL